MMFKRARTYGIVALAVAIAAGCGNDDTLTNPQFEPEIVNQVDSFELQATDITGVTETLEYTWDNTGTVANVDRSTVLTDGSGTVTVFDVDGKQVFTSDLTTDGSSSTSSGVAGAWTIRVVFSNASGTVNFRVEKG